jgi:hypothetical protein
MFFINNAQLLLPICFRGKKEKKTPQKKRNQIEKIEKIPCTYIILLVGLTSIV